MGARRSLLGACSAVSNADPTQCIYPPQVPGSHRGTYIYFFKARASRVHYFSKVGTGGTLISLSNFWGCYILGGALVLLVNFR